MIRKRWQGVPGVVAGIVAGLLISLPVQYFMLQHFASRSPAIPPVQINATATHGDELFAVATSPVGGDVEGVFFLDAVTGELQCLVKHRRNAQAWIAQFRKNVFEDLQIQQGGKKPRLLMVTGLANFPGSTGNTRMGASLVYVVDASTGRYAVYGFPWNSSAYNRGQIQVSPFLLLNAGSARQQEVIRQ